MKPVDKYRKPSYILSSIGMRRTLPCNVVIMEEERGGSTVSIGNPKEMFRLVDNRDLDSVVDEVDARLQRVLEKL